MSKNEQTWEWIINQAEPVFICFEDGQCSVYRGGYIWDINRDSTHANPIFWPTIDTRGFKTNIASFAPIACAEVIPNVHVWQEECSK